jgi:YbgC/YbaW family acyl-CoA thioester hydrolase
METRVRYRDTDSTGRIFFSRYFEFFDDSIIEFFRERGMKCDSSGNVIADNIRNNGTFVVGECHCRFLAQTSFDDLLEIVPEIETSGGKKIVFHITCYNKTKGYVSAKGSMTYFYFDPETKRAIPVPDNVITRLQKLKG